MERDIYTGGNKLHWLASRVALRRWHFPDGQYLLWTAGEYRECRCGFEFAGVTPLVPKLLYDWMESKEHFVFCESGRGQLSTGAGVPPPRIVIQRIDPDEDAHVHDQYPHRTKALIYAFLDRFAGRTVVPDMDENPRTHKAFWQATTMMGMVADANEERDRTWEILVRLLLDGLSDMHEEDEAIGPEILLSTDVWEWFWDDLGKFAPAWMREKMEEDKAVLAMLADADLLRLDMDIPE